jgi:hypothetical protein
MSGIRVGATPESIKELIQDLHAKQGTISLGRWRHFDAALYISFAILHTKSTGRHE